MWAWLNPPYPPYLPYLPTLPTFPTLPTLPTLPSLPTFPTFLICLKHRAQRCFASDAQLPRQFHTYLLYRSGFQGFVFSNRKDRVTVPKQWNLRGGRWSSVEYCTRNKENPKNPPVYCTVGAVLLVRCRQKYLNFACEYILTQGT